MRKRQRRRGRVATGRGRRRLGPRHVGGRRRGGGRDGGGRRGRRRWRRRRRVCRGEVRREGREVVRDKLRALEEQVHVARALAAQRAAVDPGRVARRGPVELGERRAAEARDRGRDRGVDLREGRRVAVVVIVVVPLRARARARMGCRRRCLAEGTWRASTARPLFACGLLSQSILPGCTWDSCAPGSLTMVAREPLSPSRRAAGPYLDVVVVGFVVASPGRAQRARQRAHGQRHAVSAQPIDERRRERHDLGADGLAKRGRVSASVHIGREVYGPVCETGGTIAEMRTRASPRTSPEPRRLWR